MTRIHQYKHVPDNAPSIDWWETEIGPIGDTMIPSRQRQVHMVSETVAVLAVAPFMFWLALRKDLPKWARVASGLIGAGTVLIDGYLLFQYAKQQEQG